MSTKAIPRIVVPAVVIGIAVVFVIMRSRDGSQDGDQPQTPDPVPAAVTESTKAEPTSDRPASDPKISSRQAPASRTDALVAKYGESRVELAGEVALDVLSLVDAAAGAQEALKENPADDPATDASILGGLSGVALREDQSEEVGRLYQEFRQREFDDLQTEASDYRKDASPLMELLLAADAASRGELDPAEYSDWLPDHAGALASLMDFSRTRGYLGSNPMDDAAFVERYRQVLDSDQRQALDDHLAYLALRDAASSASPFPPMDLEAMQHKATYAEEATVSLRQLVTAPTE
ncbi:hypothetical protein HAHE_22870 [Haloferula helveola]|uniref:Uncharacterized protein n=1 Tax=Haloferula helveola TaxID=490095 RepID=A0ABM7RAF1_9BACT|nr:hypothetical protein HAHE_22870 [Haloferula helveola]